MKKLVIIFLISIFLFPSQGFSDGEGLNTDQRSLGKVLSEELPEAEATPNQASDASFDKRLPPVLPGEVVNDSGRKMRVWSTAGPVPVSDAPEPWKEKVGGEESDVQVPLGVIVDQHDKHRR
jgi:hypothetical protein